jgi:SAM-dependent methyltransferase
MINNYDFNKENREKWIADHAARLPKGALVLDAGAGRGPYKKYFSHCRYEAQDFGREPATIGKYIDLDYECDLTQIPVEDGRFDAVICTEVIEHLPDPIEAVKELARILRPGVGVLFLTAPLGSFLHQEPFHFYGGFTPHWYKKFLGEAGLEVISIDRNMGFFSLMGQEAVRYCSYLSWKNSKDVPSIVCRFSLAFGHSIFWIISRIMVRFGPLLDKLNLENANYATIGYHVFAKKLALTNDDVPV